MKEQTRNTLVQTNEEEICKLPEKVFRIMRVRMLKNLEHKMDKMQESSNKHLKEMQPTPVFLPGKSQGQGWGSLVGCRLWGHTESDTTEVT